MTSIASTDRPIRVTFLARYNASGAQVAALLLVALFLAAFLVVPIVLYQHMQSRDPAGGH